MTPNGPLRVLFVTDSFYPETGGVERVCLESARSLARLGHSVTILSKAVDGAPAQETLGPIEVLRYPYSRAWTPLAYLSTIRSSRRLAARAHGRRPFDVIHGHLTLSFHGPLRHLARQNVRTVCTFYGPWHSEFAVESEELARTRRWPYPAYLAALGRAQRSMQAFNLRTAERRIVLSRYSMVRARELVPDLPEAAFDIIPGGVDPEVFSPAPEAVEARKAIRARLNLPEEGFLVLTVRRLVRRMGVPNLVRAAAFLRDAGKPVHLVIGGKGPEADAIGRLVGELNLADRVTFVGFVPEAVLPDFYRAADLFVLPTAEEENFGLVILEAAACACPVVATPVGSIPEVLGTLGEVFLAVDTGPAAIAEKIQWVRDHHDKVAWRFRREISPRVRADYAWDRLSARLLSVYRGEGAS